MKRTLVLGGPGAGKTERLSQLLEKNLVDGVQANRVAFVSFTRAAVKEAVDRFSKKFGLARNQTTYFRTLHSLCYWQLGIHRGQVLDARKMRAFGKTIGVHISGRAMDEIPSIEGDRLVFLQGLATSTGRDLKDVWEEIGGVEWTLLEWFSKSLKSYKEVNGLIDFADMLTLYLKDGAPVDADIAFVDEAQDLTRVQWQVVDKAFAGVKHLYIAGDDDQAIYQWAGADVERFRSLSVDEQEVLPVSHRLPKPVFDLATEIAGKIGDRYEKKWGPAGHDGSVSWIGEVGHLDLSSGEWFLLARNSFLLDRFVEECQTQGVPYSTRDGSSIDKDDLQMIEDHERIRAGSEVPPDRARAVQDMVGRGDSRKIWHEAFDNMPLSRKAYYLSMRQRGEKMKATPRIHISTIHGVKGREAPNVALILDVARRSYDEALRNPDAEHRVLYVGATRARKNLILIMPQTPMAFAV